MTGYAADIFLIIFLFALFGYIHSWLASVEIKTKILSLVGDKIAFYRLFFNLFSIAFLYVLYLLMPKPNLVIYDLKTPYDIIVLIPQFLGLAGFIWTFKYICAKEFIGIDQIKRWFSGKYNPGTLDENMTFRIGGPYKFVRHPLYFFSILILAFRPIMDLFYLTLLVCMIAYFYLGSIYEERKLIKIFGEDYIKYRETIPRIFPLKPFQPYKSELD